METVHGKDELNKREIYWISKLNSLSPNGYNISEGGNRGVPSKVSKEQLMEIIKMLQCGSSAKEIQKKYGISIQMVTDINVGRYRKVDGIDYPIRKHPSYYKGEKKCPICQSIIDRSSNLCKKCRENDDELRKYGKCGNELATELAELLSSGLSLCQIGKKYRVTSNAIKRKLVKYNIVR